MSRQIIVALLTFGLPVAAVAQDPLQGLRFESSPFETCKDVALISNSDFKKNEAFWKEAIGECGIDVQILPETGFFQTVASSLRDQATGMSSYEFLKKVGERAGSYQNLNNELADHLRHCALKDKAWFGQKAANAPTPVEREFYDYSNCDKTVGKVKKAIQEVGAKARIKRAVLESTGSPWDSTKNFLKAQIGAKLPIESMTIPAAEMDAAKKILAEDEKEVQKEFTAAIKKNMDKLKELQGKSAAGNALQSNELEDWFKGWYTETQGGKNPNSRLAKPYVDKATLPIKNKIWAKHKDDFLKHLGEVPVLAFLSSANPSDAEIAKGAAEVLKNGEAELKVIREKIAHASAPTWSNGRVPKRNAKGIRVLTDVSRVPSVEERGQYLLGMMKYGPIVNELLKEDPLSCRTATGIANMISSSELRGNATLIVGMLGTIGGAAVLGPAALGGAAFATPALLATGVGLAWGTGITYSEHKEFIRAKQRTFSVVETQESGRAIADIKDFDEARDNFILAASLSPLDFVGSGLGLKAGAAMGFTMGKMLERPGAKLALKAALEKRGLRAVEIDKLFTDLLSNNADAARIAARKIMTEIGVDANHVNFVRMAASKGLFKAENPEAFKAILNEVKDRKINLRIANDVLSNVNSAKINSGNREQVLRAAISGAEFGVQDPKKLAGVINDWDQGIEGLARAYEVAKKKLELPEVRGLASLEARQTEAFSKALDEMMDGNPAFRALSPQDRAAAKSQMMTCGIKGN